MFLQRHEKLETSLKGFNIEKYVPSEVEIQRDKGEPEDNDEEDDDNAPEEEKCTNYKYHKRYNGYRFQRFWNSLTHCLWSYLLPWLKLYMA